eukprot:6460283-Amphidinium_carterae.1
MLGRPEWKSWISESTPHRSRERGAKNLPRRHQDQDPILVATNKRPKGHQKSRWPDLGESFPYV